VYTLLLRDDDEEGAKDRRETFLLYLSTSLFHFHFLLGRATVIWLANASAISLGIAAGWRGRDSFDYSDYELGVHCSCFPSRLSR